MPNTVSLSALAAALLFVACTGDTPASPDGTRAGLRPQADFGVAEGVYEVTVENLTSGQPLTPPLLAVHRASTDLFDVGEPASLELQQIAENGNLEPMIAVLEEDRHVGDYAVVPSPDGPPPVLGGESVTGQVRASMGATRLSWVSMLICTNDGFTGVDAVSLPVHVGDVVEYETDGYDAGTEINTEDFDDLVPPCGPLTGVDSGGRGTGMSNPDLAEDGVVHHHGGIQGIADLIPALHDWSDPVARITIERVE